MSTDEAAAAASQAVAGAALEIKSKREAELEEIRRKHLAKTWKDQHGNAPAATPEQVLKVDETTAAAVKAKVNAKVGSAGIKTMDDFNTEQRRRTEESRRNQADAVNSLHSYRGNVDAAELQRRALAEENRRKQLEAQNMLHEYRGGADNVGNTTPRKARDDLVADVRAGEKRDDVVFSGLPKVAEGTSNEINVGMPKESAQRAGATAENEHDGGKRGEEGDASAPFPIAENQPAAITQDAAVVSTPVQKGEEKKDEVSPPVTSSFIPAPEEVTTAIPSIATLDNRGVNVADADAGPEASASFKRSESSTVSKDAWEDEIAASTTSLPTEYDRGTSCLSNTDDRACMMRHNIDFSFGFITKHSTAPPTGTFPPAENHDNLSEGVKGNVEASSMLGKFMSAAEVVVQTALVRTYKESGQFNENDPFSGSEKVEGIVYDPDYAPYIVEVVDDVFYTPPADRPGTVRRFVRGVIPIFIRKGHVEMTESIRNEIIDALRMACANGTFSDATDRAPIKDDVF